MYLDIHPRPFAWGRWWAGRPFRQYSGRTYGRDSRADRLPLALFLLSSLPLSTHAADLRLCHRALRGDEAGRVEFAQRMGCLPALLRSIESRSGWSLSESEREEVCQRTVTAVWSKLGTFTGTSKLETWAYGFCLNELRKFRDRRVRAAREGAALESASAEKLITLDPDPVDHDHLYSCLDQLGSPASEILRMKHFEELTFDEIGERLDMSPNTTKTTYYRSLKKLRDALGPTWRQEQP